MRFTNPVESWVVYQATGKHGGGRAMCPASEWPTLEAAGHVLMEAAGHVLIRGGITNEGEAERLARGTSGDPRPRAATPAAALAAVTSTRPPDSDMLPT